MITVSKNNDYSKCTTEQQFKMSYIKKELHYYTDSSLKVFCIETEETVHGFPDVMTLYCCKKEHTNFARFYEFKISNMNGKIKFQPTQPAFYKNNMDMSITVIALNKKTGRVHTFPVECLFDKESPYCMFNAEVNLMKGEV